MYVHVMQTSNILNPIHISSFISGNPFYMKTAISTGRRRVAMLGKYSFSVKPLNIDY